MMDAIAAVLALVALAFPVAVLIWLLRHGSRLRRIEEFLLQPSPAEETHKQIAALTTRVYALEQQLRALVQAALAAPQAGPSLSVPPKPAPPPRPPVAIPPAAREPAAPVPPQPSPEAVPPAFAASPVSCVAPPPPPFTAVLREPRVPWRERIFGGEEWEAVIGGSWLNKLGAVILVVGLALLLGYSASRVGPLGRVLISLAASATLLLTGVTVEGRGRLRVFARGLIGAGWAGLYATVYAMHSVEAARVVPDPLAGAALLLAVAVGMIVHSLRYRSEAITGVAYAAAYISLAITPLAPFSVVGLFPITASLLFLSTRMRWHTAALLSLLATYFVCATRESHGAPLWSSVALIAGYWLAFEIYDVARSTQRLPVPARAHAVWPLNGAFALALSYAKWHSAQPQSIHWLLAGAGAVFVLTAIARAVVRPPSSFEEGQARLDGYEPAVTVAAGLLAWGSLEGFTLARAVSALAVEAECLFAAGLLLRATHLRRLAAAVFAAAAVALGVDVSRAEPAAAGALLRHPWTPAAALLAALFYLNRLLRRPGLAYSWTASAVVMTILGFEIPLQHLGLAWLAFAVLLFESGLLRRLAEFRSQGYMAGATAAVTLLLVNAAGAGLPDSSGQWQRMLVAALVYYAVAVQAARLWPASVQKAGERAGVRDVCAAAGTAAASVMLWYALPSPLVALGWGALALALFEAAPLVSSFRLYSAVVAAMTFARLFFGNFTNLGFTSVVSHRVLTVLPVVCLFYFLWSRLRVSANRQFAWEERLARAYLYAPVILWTVLLRFELGRTLAVTGWAVTGLVLLAAGVRTGVADLRLQSYALAALTFIRSWNTNFYIADSLLGMRARVLTGAFVIASLYIGEFLAPRKKAGESWPARADAHARMSFSLMATILLAALIYYEVSGTLLTVGWGMQGAALLAAGFVLRERWLRLPGLALLLVCAAKLFAYDLRQLEIVYRILSFLVLGLLLLGASWVYTRFRGEVKRYL